MQKITKDKFVVNKKEDLYSTVLVKAFDNYYHGYTYNQYTPFGVSENIEIFTKYLYMLSREEVINYRDKSGGNIMYDMCYSNKGIEYFDILLKYIGGREFAKMIKAKDNTGICPLCLIKDLSLFKYLLSFVQIDGKMLYQIVLKTPNNQICNYLSELINKR